MRSVRPLFTLPLFVLSCLSAIAASTGNAVVSGTMVTGKITEAGTGKPVGGYAIIPLQTGPLASEWNKQFAGNDVPYSATAKMAAVALDGTGEFRLGPLPPATYRLVVLREMSGADKKSKGLPVVKEISLVVKPRDKSKRLKITVPSSPNARSISGRVKNIDNAYESVANIEILIKVYPKQNSEAISSDYMMPRRVKTDAKGNYTIYPVLPGNYYIIANGPGGFSTADVEIKDKSLTGINFGFHFE